MPRYVPYLFIAPNMVLFLLFMIIPIVFTLGMGFMEWNILTAPKWVGLDNYIKLFTADKVFWKSFWNTLYLTVATVPITLVLALALAMLLNKRLLFRGFFRSAFYLPVVISTVVIGMLWTWIFNDDYGILNYLLTSVGLNRVNWFTDSRFAMIPVIVASIWNRVGYSMVIYLAALQGISPEYYEAAMIDGASHWQQFKRVTFPLLRSTHVFLLIMAIINSFKSFDIIYVMTNGGPRNSTTTIVQYIYKQAFENGKMGEASALGVILFVIMVVLTIIQLRAGDKE